MFESLIPWCKFPVFIHKCLGTNAAGDKEYEAPVAFNGYRVDEVRDITDKLGINYVSYSHVYFPPEVPIGVDDCLSFPDDERPREVRKLGGFFDGNTGMRSIWVVYL